MLISRRQFEQLLSTLDLSKREDRQAISEITIDEVHGRKRVFAPPQPYRGFSLDGPATQRIVYRPRPRVVFDGSWRVVELLEPFSD